jgi:hypothetical protein
VAMTSSIALFGVVADVVLLLSLVAAVASPRVSQAARPAIATFAFACAWLVTAGVDAMGAPGWTIFLGGAVIVASIVVLIATLHIWTQGGDVADRGPHRGDGGDGPRRPRPDAPQRGGGGTDPSWWPAFERQLATYVAEREREKREPAVFPAEPAPRAITPPPKQHSVPRNPPPAGT